MEVIIECTQQLWVQKQKVILRKHTLLFYFNYFF